MGFETFEKFDTGSGVLKIDMMGTVQEIPYEAAYYINGEGTVAAVETPDESGKAKFIFYSKLPDKEVMTAEGQGQPTEIDGILLNTLPQGSSRDDLVAKHMETIGDAAIADAAALKAAIKDVPQRYADAGMKLMAQMMAAFQQG